MEVTLIEPRQNFVIGMIDLILKIDEIDKKTPWQNEEPSWWNDMMEIKEKAIAAVEKYGKEKPSGQPSIIDVAVISMTQQSFKEWVFENKKPGEEYHCITKSSDIVGRRFDKIERNCPITPDTLLMQKLCIINLK